MQRLLCAAVSAAALEQSGAQVVGVCGIYLQRPRCRRSLVGSQTFQRQGISSQNSKSRRSSDSMVDLPLLVVGGDDAPQPSAMSSVTDAPCLDATATAAVKSMVTDGEQARTELDSVESLELDLPIPLTPFSSEYSKTVELQRAIVAEAAMKSKTAVTKEDVIFEDEWLLVLNKPSGIYSEHVLATVKIMLRGNHESTSDAAGDSAVESNGAASEPFAHLANRLDRDTSGVLVLAKCKGTCAKLTKVFTERQVEKTYIARCAGQPPEWQEVLIQSGHGRSRFGAWRVYSVHDIGRKLPGRGGSLVKDMKTRLHVLGDRDHGEGADLDVLVTTAMPTQGAAASGFAVAAEADGPAEVILRAFPLTGRTHQVRLHCCYLGLPLIGDVKYGGPHDWNGVRYDGHCLHAESLSFQHPVTLQMLHLVAPMPNWQGCDLIPSSQHHNTNQMG